MMNANSTTERNPWTAAGLTLLLPGLGQVYCGALSRGLVFMAVSTLVGVLAIFVTAVSDGGGSGVWLAMLYLASLGVFVVALVDGYRTARRTRDDYRLKEYNRGIVYAMLLVIATGGALGYGLYVRESLMKAYFIPNQSMYPSLRAGDRILATLGNYEVDDPSIGDVVIFRDPENRSRNYVKRVVALAGDTVEVRDGVLIVNSESKTLESGEPAEFSRKGKTVRGTVRVEQAGGRAYSVFISDNAKLRARDNLAPLEVPPHHVFMLGDHRTNSKDSRNFGPVPVEALVGKVQWTVLAPDGGLSRMGRFEG